MKKGQSATEYLVLVLGLIGSAYVLQYLVGGTLYYSYKHSPISYVAKRLGKGTSTAPEEKIATGVDLPQEPIKVDNYIATDFPSTLPTESGTSSTSGDSQFSSTVPSGSDQTIIQESLGYLDLASLIQGPGGYLATQIAYRNSNNSQTLEVIEDNISPQTIWKVVANHAEGPVTRVEIVAINDRDQFSYKTPKQMWNPTKIFIPPGIGAIKITFQGAWNGFESIAFMRLGKPIDFSQEEQKTIVSKYITNPKSPYRRSSRYTGEYTLWNKKLLYVRRGQRIPQLGALLERETALTFSPGEFFLPSATYKFEIPKDWQGGFLYVSPHKGNSRYRSPFLGYKITFYISNPRQLKAWANNYDNWQADGNVSLEDYAEAPSLRNKEDRPSRP